MNVNILYLYPDFMSLYGDNGNVSVVLSGANDWVKVGSLHF